MAVKVPITRNVEIKKPYTDAEKLAIMEEISEADKVIEGKKLDLEAAQEGVKSIKEAIAGQYQVMSDLCAKYRLGYDSKWLECTVTYNKGMATFVDAKSGEVVEERAITPEEQLALSENRVDAENIIRQANEEEP